MYNDCGARLYPRCHMLKGLPSTVVVMRPLVKTLLIAVECIINYFSRNTLSDDPITVHLSILPSVYGHLPQVSTRLEDVASCSQGIFHILLFSWPLLNISTEIQNLSGSDKHHDIRVRPFTSECHRVWKNQ